MLRILFAAATAVALCAPAAFACEGQTGKVIFEDKFTDDTGGWTLGAPDSEIKNGSLLLHANAHGVDEKNTSSVAINVTFPAGDGDYCMEFVLPKQVAPDNDVATAMVFWISNASRFSFAIWTDKSAVLGKFSGDKWDYPFSEKQNAAIKLEPNAVNILRVVAKENKLTLFINGSQVKVIRALMPAGELHFGITSTVQKASDANPVVEVKSFKLTTGE
jgi:hypothetical protein